MSWTGLGSLAWIVDSGGGWRLPVAVCTSSALFPYWARGTEFELLLSLCSLLTTDDNAMEALLFNVRPSSLDLPLTKA